MFLWQAKDKNTIRSRLFYSFYILIMEAFTKFIKWLIVFYIENVI